MPLRKATVAGFTLFTLFSTFLKPFAFLFAGEVTEVLGSLFFTVVFTGYFTGCFPGVMPPCFTGTVLLFFVENLCCITLPKSSMPFP